MDTDTLSSGTLIYNPHEEKQDGLGQQKQHDDDHSHQDADKSHHQQQKTLALIKPDAMQANHKQAIIDKINSSGFTILQQKQVLFDLEKACLFYREHEHKPFYPDLTEWMASAPIYAMVLEKENAIQDWRSLMGPTNAIKAREIDPTSIRALFGTDGSHNATHGSDCLTSAEREIDIVFGSPQELSVIDNKTHHDLSTTNTSGEEDSSLPIDYSSPVPPSTLNDNDDDKINDLGDNSDNANIPVLLPSNVDVEHPDSTHDLLSHLASPDAPTCPISDSVKPSSTDESATVAAAETDICREEDAATTDVQASTSIITTADNNNDDDANETTTVNSIVDETPEQNKSDSLPNSSSLSKQQDHQEDLVTESITTQALDDHSTTETGPSHETSVTQQDENEVLDGHLSSPVNDYTPTVATHEKDDDDNTERTATLAQPEADLLLADEEKTAGDHDNTTSHGLDTINKTKEEAPVTSDNLINDEEPQQQQHEDAKALDDDSHDLTPIQETESLAIKEAIVNLDAKTETTAPTTTHSNDIKTETIVDADDHQQQGDSTISSEPLTTHVDNIKESATIPTNDNDDDLEKDDKESGLDVKETQPPTDQKPLEFEEHQEDTAADEKFDTIPLASDAEATTIVAEECIKPAVNVAVAVVTEEVASQVSEQTVSVEASKPIVDSGAVVVVVEENGGQDPEPLVSVVESKPVSSVETLITAPVDNIIVTDEHADHAPVDDGPATEEHVDHAPVDGITATEERVNSTPINAVSVKPESVEEPLPATEVSSTGIKEETTTEATNEESPVEVIDDTKSIEQPTKDEKEPEVTEVAIVDEEIGSTEHQHSDVEELRVNDDQPNGDKADNDKAESLIISSHETETIHDETMDQSHDHKQEDAITTTAEEELLTEDTTKATIDREHTPEGSNQSACSTDGDETTVDQIKSVSSSDEEEKTVDQGKTPTSDESSETAAKEKEVASPANKLISPTRSPTRKPPTSGLKAPTKIGTTRKVAGTSNSKNTTTAPTTTRLRRPGTTATSGTTAATGSDKPTVKKATGLKSSASPGRTPLPRVATLAKKPDSAAASTNTAETKPATATTKKRSSVINRLTAPTTASANKRTSDTAATPGIATKVASGNGTTGTHRAKATSATTTATTRRTTTATTTTTTKSATEKPAIRRTSPSSTADKPAVTRRVSPPTSTTLHANKTSARSSTTTSSRLSSTTATSKSPSPDHTGAKRAPVRRISPPSSTHPSTATKPSSKNPIEKKGEIKRKVATKPSGTKPAVKKDAPKNTDGGDAHSKPDAKDDEDAHTEPTNDGADHGENLKPNEEPSTEEHQESSVEEHQESSVEEHQEPSVEEHQEPSVVEEHQEPSVVEEHQEPSVEEKHESLVEEPQTTAPVESQGQTPEVTVNPEDKTTLKPTATISRPKTPELAQLRNKFETLQTSVTPTRSSNNKPSSAPHNIKDLISRFN